MFGRNVGRTIDFAVAGNARHRQRPPGHRHSDQPGTTRSPAWPTPSKSFGKTPSPSISSWPSASRRRCASRRRSRREPSSSGSRSTIWRTALRCLTAPPGSLPGIGVPGVAGLARGIHRERAELCRFIRFLATHGEYGAVESRGGGQRFTETAAQSYTFERTRPDGTIIEIRHNPLPGGGHCHHLYRHYRAQALRGCSQGRARSGRGDESDEVELPRQHEP